METQKSQNSEEHSGEGFGIQNQSERLSLSYIDSQGLERKSSVKDRAERLSGGAKDVRESYLSKQMLIMSDVLQANQQAEMQDELPSPSEIDGF